MLRAGLWLVAGACLAGCSEKTAETGAANPSMPEEAVARLDRITGQGLTAHVAELSSDDYGGRAPGSVGDRMARNYITERLRGLGLSPGAPGGGWEQHFELVGLTSEPPGTWQFTGHGRTASLLQRTEFMVAPGVQRPEVGFADAEVVFVGYGIRAPEYGWDDYAGADVAGKVVLVLNNDPDWDPALFAGKRRLYYGRYTYKYETAAAEGAVGAIVVHTPESAGYPWRVVQTSWSGTRFELPAGPEPRLEVAAWITEAAAARLAELSGHTLGGLMAAARTPGFEAVDLGTTTSFSMNVRLSDSGSANVLGLLPGSDPERAGEMVVYTAHHDHLGMADRPDASGDRVYNGARDNASGTAMVLSIATAMADLAPARSVLFAFVGAEEQGLLGSTYLARNPPAPVSQIAAVFNFDGGNIWGRTRDVTLIGLGKSNLDDVARDVAAYQSREARGDQHPDQGLFYRSDHFSLARRGVPGLFVSVGTEFRFRPPDWGRQQIAEYVQRHYHQPDDELTPEWDFAGMVEDARFGFLAGWLVANQDEMPEWYPDDEFAGERAETAHR